MKTTVGTLDPPLGNTRWNVAKLLSALAATNTPAINQELAQLGTVDVLLVNLSFPYLKPMDIRKCSKKNI